MDWLPIGVLTLQIGLLAAFAFFAFFNFLYAFASFKRVRLKKTEHSDVKVAVVVVSFNEKHVLPRTVQACEKLTYDNKLVVLSDDSDDPAVVADLRALAAARGCKLKDEASAELWESPQFVYFHRRSNFGFKGGNLKELTAYLRSRGISVMYLLDADWQPQADAIERSLEILEADPRVAFVQTKRITSEHNIGLFQRYVSLNEEGCYYVDFAGRQALGHPTLFSGCCALLRLEAVDAVGGITPYHLTEDLDLTNRLWLAGWKGIYCADIVNYGEVPFRYQDFRKQQERWSSGTARCLRTYFWPILRCRHLSLIEKLSALRQNSYFTTSMLTLAAIVQGAATVFWLSFGAGTYPVEHYLYLLDQARTPLMVVIYGCVLSNFVEPLVMILAKKRQPGDLLHLPMGIWYAWSLLAVYVQGSLKGLLGTRMEWFCTPKFLRDQEQPNPKQPLAIRATNMVVCLSILSVYLVEGWTFGWRDPFALLLMPAFWLSIRD